MTSRPDAAEAAARSLSRFQRYETEYGTVLRLEVKRQLETIREHENRIIQGASVLSCPLARIPIGLWGLNIVVVGGGPMGQFRHREFLLGPHELI